MTDTEKLDRIAAKCRANLAHEFPDAPEPKQARAGWRYSLRRANELLHRKERLRDESPTAKETWSKEAQELLADWQEELL